MEDCTREDNNSKKRERDDSGQDTISAESKRFRSDSANNTSDIERVESDPPENVTNSSELDRVESTTNPSELDPVDAEPSEMISLDPKITEDILDILDDLDRVNPDVKDLDSVIKSFEEEILNPTDSGELDYLLGASDDELGLPPAFSPSDTKPENKACDSVTNPPEPVENFACVDELPSYDSFEFGIGDDTGGYGDFVTLPSYDPFDFSEANEYLWRPETLPAV